MKVFSLLAAVLFGLAANAETKEIIWDSGTIQSISLGRSFFENEDSASIVTAKDGIYLKIEVLSGTMIDFYGRGIYTNGKVFFTPSEGKLTQVVFNASKENNLDGWTTRGTQLVWTGNADRAYINNSTSSVSVEGIQSISFMVEAEEKTDTISPSAGVEVNEVNFPDASFRRWIQGQSYGSDLMLTADVARRVEEHSTHLAVHSRQPVDIAQCNGLHGTDRADMYRQPSGFAQCGRLHSVENIELLQQPNQGYSDGLPHHEPARCKRRQDFRHIQPGRGKRDDNHAGGCCKD